MPQTSIHKIKKMFSDREIQTVSPAMWNSFDKSMINCKTTF